MIGYILSVIYIIFTVLGLLLIKLSGSTPYSFGVNMGYFEIRFNYLFILGLFSYIISFAIYVSILPRFKLSTIYPILSGIVYIGVFIASVLILKETLDLRQIVGGVIILLGIIIMNVR